MPSASTSSNLENTSAILGEYMLKGWTLTDLHCDVCNTTPLMREPSALAANEGRVLIQFCALCDGGPTPSRGQSSRPINSPPIAEATSSRVGPLAERPGSGSRSTGGSSADDAASSISQLLLQGYSLLGSNCPLDSCRGIPLVGYPRKKDGSRDGRRMCVGCGGRWVDEGDLKGMTLVQEQFQSGPQSIGSAADRGGAAKRQEDVAESPRSRKRRELYEEGERMVSLQQAKVESQVEAGVGGLDKGKSAARYDDDGDDEMDIEEDIEQEGDGRAQPVDRGRTAIPSVEPSLQKALDKSASALALTLDRLAASLETHTAGKSKADEARYFVDVKLHTEAMKDVLEVLALLKK